MTVLDTHVLLWLANSPTRLSKPATSTIPVDGQVAVSAVTAYEIAYLALRKRLELDRPATEWIADALFEHEIELVPPNLDIAVRAGSLPTDRFPGDPADRLIYATAVERGARLVSADQRLRDYDPARVVW